MTGRYGDLGIPNRKEGNVMVDLAKYVIVVGETMFVPDMKEPVAFFCSDLCNGSAWPAYQNYAAEGSA
jgi:hypothetical protein